ncbi:MAG: M20/M25/M40 family metallo-hydrolase [Melioribacteraceae bacterium]|nr:M20/M25/M40 family metallo-hydrolase [Melioribacteraceae bacterium]
MNITHVEPELIKIFSEITKINALSQQEKPVADYIKNFLSQLSIEFYEDESQFITGSNSGNLVAEINGGGDFILTSHMDTARPTHDVKIILDEDRIRSDGRTVLGVDNRIGNSILLALLKFIKQNNIEVKPFSVGFTVCEETTLAGSKNILLKDTIKNAYVFDSYLDTGFIVNRALGAVTFKYTVLGKASHSGISPEKGINSIKIVSEILAQIQQGRIAENTTLNVGRIEGGSAVNVVPEQTVFEGEIRSNNKEEILIKISELDEKIEKVCSIYNAKFQKEITWDFEPYSIDEESEIFKNIKNAIEECGLVAVATLSRGGSDANSFNARGVKALNLGIGAKNPHSNDEYILYKDFQKAFEVALNLVKK